MIDLCFYVKYFYFYKKIKMQKILFTLIGLICLSITNIAAQIAWETKVETSILEKIAQDNHDTDFIVWLATDTDLSKAQMLSSKLEKGKFVFEELSKTAAATQKNVISVLKSSKRKYYPLIIVNAVVGRGNRAIIEQLASLPEVKMILADPAVKMQYPVESSEGERTAEWGIQKIKADSIWLLGFKGSGAVVAGQDTGYDWQVPALKDKYRGWNGSYAVHNYNWFDAVDSLIVPNSTQNPWGYSVSSPIDDDGHGTHTMGTMVGKDGAYEIGVAPQAKWIGCRNMDRGWGKPSSYTKCFNWFLAPRDSLGNNPMPALAPDVINNSWGCPPVEGCTTAGTYALMEQAVNNLKAAGVMVVVSAGNDGPNCRTIMNPASIFENSFTVGATDINDNIASFSSRGPATTNGIYRLKPNVTAPGVGVFSCLPSWQGTYGVKSGTSMAGPHVAGAVALLLSAQPTLKGQVNTIETILESTANALITADTCGQTQGITPNNVFGYGRINLLQGISQTLPISLINFYVTVEDAGNHLFWQTNLEMNSDYFEIEKSTDGIAFAKINTLKAQGFSAVPSNYDLLDKDTTEGVFYYRLKMYDKDRSFKYSKIIACVRVNKSHITIGPNPADGFLNIRMNLAAEHNIKFEVINTLGQIITELSTIMPQGYNIVPLSTSNLANGYYQLRIIQQNKLIYQQPILVRH